MKLANLAVILSLLQAASAKVIGFTIDDESCSGLGPNVTEQLAACERYFDELKNWTQLAHGAGLTMSADAGTGWVCPGTAEATQCVNITYGGKNASVAEHVVDLVDTTVLMDYDTTLEKVTDRAEPYLNYADSVGKAVVIGLAVVNPGDEKQWWQNANEKDLEDLMGQVFTSMKVHKSFTGTAVFTSGSWYNQSLATPYTGPFYTPVSMWYIDPSVAYNTTLQQSWLTFATTRKVSGWYVAPHHGDRPLIGGNPQDQQAFCALIKKADALGIDFSFFSSLSDANTQDIPFIRSC
eukprot:TRINITY_DN20939_c0_g1_i1.p2 TRINITY_DN20939_c0_g1~~TRINITY_DN20939_c0_g1_i1.p2  ORF type:complete len:307 (+),score=62.35 TRINITY_DN20939_c0_g1_i1:41-922(+)